MICVLLSGIRNDSVDLHLVRALRESGIHLLVIDHPSRIGVAARAHIEGPFHFGPKPSRCISVYLYRRIAR